MLTVVSDICFYPTSAGGSSSFSGMMRTQEYWHGTLVMDEADWTGDKESSIVKYLNAGFERDKYFILSNKNDPSKQEVFDPFSTKIIAMREPFRDNATEGRLLSISPHETTKASIPILLGKEYYEEAAELRNEIARFVLVHWNDVDGEKMLDFRGLGIEPRLQQLAKPLSIIFQMWNDGEEIFKRYILKRQKELKKERAQSWDGSMFNFVYAVSIGEEDVLSDFDSYYNQDTGDIPVITPNMVGKAFNTSARTATKTLKRIGFDVERRHITIYRKLELDKYAEKDQVVRAYVVPEEQRWREIVQRYYYDEDANNGDYDIEIPEILKSKTYTRVSRSVTSGTSVTKDEKPVTDVTDVTQYITRQEKNEKDITDDETLEDIFKEQYESKGIGKCPKCGNERRLFENPHNKEENLCAGCLRNAIRGELNRSVDFKRVDGVPEANIEAKGGVIG